MLRHTDGGSQGRWPRGRLVASTVVGVSRADALAIRAQMIDPPGRPQGYTMAAAPKKPATGTAKANPKKTVDQKAIDRAVELCVAHLVRLKSDSAASEVIGKLKAAYQQRRGREGKVPKSFF